jgi:cytoskeletal protein RodZ
VKSFRLEIAVLIALLLGAMGAFVWMQSRSTKARGPKPSVAIQDGKTIDFSSGVPLIKDDAKQKAALEKSLKEMDAATANVTFPPTGQKKADTPPSKP